MMRGMILGALALLTGCVTNGEESGSTACLDHFNAGRHREALQVCAAREEALIKRQPPIEAPLLAEIMLVRARAMLADGQHVAAFRQATATATRVKEDKSPAGRVVHAQSLVLMADIALGQGAIEVTLGVIDTMQIRFAGDRDPVIQAEWSKAQALRAKLANKDFEQNSRTLMTRLARMPASPRVVAGVIGQAEELAAARGRAPTRRSLRDQGMIAAAAYIDGHYDTAAEGFRHMLAQPLDERLKIWAQLGRAASLVRQGHLADSLDLLDQVIATQGAQPPTDGAPADLARLEKSGALVMLGRVDDVEPLLDAVIRRHSRVDSPESHRLIAEAKVIRQSAFLSRLDGLNAWRVGQDLLRQFEADPSDDIQRLLAFAHLQQGLAQIARGDYKAGINVLASVDKRYRSRPDPQQQRVAILATTLRGVMSGATKRHDDAIEACQQARSDIDRQAQQFPKHLLPSMRAGAVFCLVGALTSSKRAPEALAALESVEPEIMASPVRGDRNLQAQLLMLKMALQVQVGQAAAAQQTYEQMKTRFDPAIDRDLETILAPAGVLHRLLQVRSVTTG